MKELQEKLFTELDNLCQYSLPNKKADKSRSKSVMTILRLFDDITKNHKLSNFLNWKENIVYKYKKKYFIILNDTLYKWNKKRQKWMKTYDEKINFVDELRLAKEVNYNKYILKHKYLYTKQDECFLCINEKHNLILVSNHQ